MKYYDVAGPGCEVGAGRWWTFFRRQPASARTPWLWWRLSGHLSGTTSSHRWGVVILAIWQGKLAVRPWPCRLHGVAGLGVVAAGGAVGPTSFWHLGSDNQLVRPTRREWRKRRRRARSIFIPARATTGEVTGRESWRHPVLPWNGLAGNTEWFTKEEDKLMCGPGHSVGRGMRDG
jgi:hypothetical protein